MKRINQFITEYIIKKKLDKPIDSEDHYEYFPETKDELIKVIQILLDKGETDLNCIDTNKITDMSELFYNKEDINIDVSKWNVSNVEDMNRMFYNCEDFNCDLSNWDVSKVENMERMFHYCEKFNCDLSKWNVSKVKNMSYMFYSCKNFDCDLSNWDVSNVEKIDHMFCECKIFIGKGLDNWNINKKVVDMSNMFDGCRKFNCDLNKWNTKRVKDMRYMFYNCDSLKNKPNWYKA